MRYLIALAAFVAALSFAGNALAGFSDGNGATVNISWAHTNGFSDGN